MYTFFSWLFAYVTTSAKRRNRWLGFVASLVCLTVGIFLAYARIRHNFR